MMRNLPLRSLASGTLLLAAACDFSVGLERGGGGGGAPAAPHPVVPVELSGIWKEQPGGANDLRLYLTAKDLVLHGEWVSLPWPPSSAYSSTFATNVVAYDTGVTWPSRLERSEGDSTYVLDFDLDYRLGSDAIAGYCERSTYQQFPAGSVMMSRDGFQFTLLREQTAATVVALGSECPPGQAVPLIAAGGPRIGATFVVQGPAGYCIGMESCLVALVMGLGQANVPITHPAFVPNGCSLLVTHDFVRPTGPLPFTDIAIPDQVSLVGFRFYLQEVKLSLWATGGNTIEFTDVLECIVGT